MAIARNPTFVLDCPDVKVLASFYAALLGWEEVDLDDDWITISNGTTEISFQQVDDYAPPVWPGQQHPQQVHLDVDVDDMDEAEAALVALGATRHEVQPGTTFRVMLDPAGHPFCVCVGWKANA